jgi:hypothetical protein
MLMFEPITNIAAVTSVGSYRSASPGGRLPGGLSQRTMMNIGTMPRQVWVEMHDAVERDSCDVIVEMEDGSYYTAPFVTLPYLRRQMDLGYAMGKGMRDGVPVCYTALETPHIVVENLERNTIEDTIDNLLALDVFESIFTVVIKEEATAPAKLATAEIAAVVLTEVLMAEGDTPVA